MSDITVEELSERTLDASMRELKTLEELLLLIRANAPKDYNIPSFQEVRKKTKDIYKSTFTNISRKKIYIPIKTKPAELISFLKENNLV